MAKQTKAKEFDFGAEYKKMQTYGVEQVLPPTGRKIKLKSVDAESLLKEGQIPNILTPLIVKMVYQDLSGNEIRQFVEGNKGQVQDALGMVETLNFIAKYAITDGTKVESLTLAEKRWIFRLVMGAAELLITFRFDQDPDVEVVSEG